MSRYTFDAIDAKSADLLLGEVHAGQAVRVVLGWDKPLQGFFMNIEALPAGEDGPVMLFSSLAAENAYPDNLDGFLEVLHGMGLALPLDIAGHLICDQVNSKLLRAGER